MSAQHSSLFSFPTHRSPLEINSTSVTGADDEADVGDNNHVDDHEDPLDHDDHGVPLDIGQEDEHYKDIQTNQEGEYGTNYNVYARKTLHRVNKARRAFYASRILSHFSEISWQFCIVLFLTAVADYRSLALVSTFGLCSGLAMALTGPLVGRFIDGGSDSGDKVGLDDDHRGNEEGGSENGINIAEKNKENEISDSEFSKSATYSPDASSHRRWNVARTFILGRNLSVLGAAFCCHWILSRGSDGGTIQRNVQYHDEECSDCPISSSPSSSAPPPSSSLTSTPNGPAPTWIQSRLAGVPTDRLSLLLLLAIHILGSTANIMEAGFTLIMERDWIVVMAEVAKGAQQPMQQFQPRARAQLQASSPSPPNTIMTNELKEDASSIWLSQTNVMLRQIDLTCKILGPSVSGMFIAVTGSGGGGHSSNESDEDSKSNHKKDYEDDDDEIHGRNNLQGATLLVGLITITSLMVQYASTRYVYALIKELSSPKINSSRSLSDDNDVIDDNVERKIGEEKEGNDVDDAENNDNDIGFGSVDKSIGANNLLNHGTTLVEQANNYRSGNFESFSFEPVNDDDDGDDNGQHLETFKNRWDITYKRCRHQFRHNHRLCCAKLCNETSGIRIYFQQSISWGGLALALLYENVLTFGGLMTAYLASKDMSPANIGLWRGISAGMGLIGTCSYNSSLKCSGLAFTGLWGIASQFAFLTVSYASLFFEHHANVSLSMLVGGVCMSRVGLHVFDLAVIQFMQLCVPEEFRGIVGGVQTSMQSTFQFLMYVLGLVFPDPNDFSWMVGLGYLSVGAAMVIYTMGVYFRRDVLPVQ